MQYFISSFYFFKTIKEPEDLQKKLNDLGKKLNLKGLIILSHEGINLTVSGDKNSVESFKSFFKEKFCFPIHFKDSLSSKSPFRRFKVKFKKEIVTAKLESFELNENSYLNPLEWNEKIKENKNLILVDARNWYETKLGLFRKALDLKINQFTEFKEHFKNKKIPKDKEVLIYCTGGIRCEKAAYLLNEMGYKKVFQLKGGILDYLKKAKESFFDGECFVFDHRVSVDKNLEETKKYSLCPHLGQPANIKITCLICSKQARIHELAKDDFIYSNTCSKNCAHKLKLKKNKGLDFKLKA